MLGFLLSLVVVINEISPSSELEWIELFNPGSEPHNLVGWSLVDNNNLDDDIILDVTLESGQYFVATNSGKTSWLNNSGDTVTLFDVSHNTIDSLVYGTIQSGKTIGRVPDESENWLPNLSPTMGFANPTPSPTPSPIPTPTLAPLPTVTPTPTPTSTPVTPAPSPSSASLALALASPRPLPSKEPSHEGTVAGQKSEINLAGFGVSPSPSLEPSVQNIRSGIRLDRALASFSSRSQDT